MNSTKALLAAGAMALMAGTAQAKIVTVTWTGMVADGIDYDASFSDAGTDLAGYSFVSVYRFDTSLGAYQSDATSTDIQGGDHRSAPTPVLSASITINGRTVTYAGSYFGEIYSQFDNQPQFYTEGADTQDRDLWNYLQPNGPAGPWATASFADFDGDVSGIEGGGGFSSDGDLFDLTNQHLTIRSDGAVPEPASWALMVGGFGLVGGALRGRTRRTVSFG